MLIRKRRDDPRNEQKWKESGFGCSKEECKDSKDGIHQKLSLSRPFSFHGRSRWWTYANLRLSSAAGTDLFFLVKQFLNPSSNLSHRDYRVN